MAGELAIGRRVPGGHPGRMFSRPRRGSTVLYLELLLDDCDYPDGGWVLNPGITGLHEITDAEQLCALDPYGDAVGATGIQAIVTINATEQKLKLYSEGGFEVEEGWTGFEDARLWLGLIGVS